MGNRLTGFVASSITRRRLRILAYHSVHDAVSFERQMSILRREYTVVSADDALASLEGQALPDKAVWVTFDDGDPSVVEVALPILQRFEIPSTMFVCPSVIDTNEPLWWQAVDLSLGAGIEFVWRERPYDRTNADQLTRALKAVPDVERRRVVNELVTLTESKFGSTVSRPQLNASQIRRFVGSGGTLANHTWDHPCLDVCTPDEQKFQIVKAHDYLAAWTPHFRPVLAYPNGNFAPVAADTAHGLGYQLGVLFDHLLTNTLMQPMLWSRLRANSDSNRLRFRAIVSGVHGAALSRRKFEHQDGLST